MAYEEAIGAHYRANWGHPVASSRWELGPVSDLPIPFHVEVFQRQNGALVFGSVGMSQLEDAERIELHMLAPHDTSHAHIVELLTVVAHYHRTGQRVGLGDSVNFGRPWLPSATCSYGLVSLPYLDGPKLEWSENPRTRFLWLVPITERERAFKKEHGVEALEATFEARGLDHLDVTRDSLV
jgi:Suppressor of fused protein (SUFU)